MRAFRSVVRTICIDITLANLGILFVAADVCIARHMIGQAVANRMFGF